MPALPMDSEATLAIGVRGQPAAGE
jgi:hypothetical protein